MRKLIIVIVHIPRVTLMVCRYPCSERGAIPSLSDRNEGNTVMCAVGS